MNIVTLIIALLWPDGRIIDIQYIDYGTMEYCKKAELIHERIYNKAGQNYLMKCEIKKVNY